MRQKVVLATKCAGPGRNLSWVHGGSADLHPAQIAAACDGSLKRLQTDVIDLYQIHWPNRNVPTFGAQYFDPSKDQPQTSIHDQLQALAGLVKAGKVRHIGLSNESPWGVMEFLRLAELHGLPRVVSVQNAYALVNRSHENGLDEVLHRTGVGLLAYSPLGFGSLTGKYDGADFEQPDTTIGRLTRFPQMKTSRWNPPRGAGRRARVQRAGARTRPHAGADGAGLLLPQLARGEHDRRRDQRGAARRMPGCVERAALARAAGRHRRDPLEDPRSGAVKAMRRK